MRKSMVLAIILLCSLTLYGCRSKEKATDSQETEYRTEFTEQEVKNGHASFELLENVTVDADVTTKDMYENGLNSYYIKHVYECEKGESAKLAKNPTVYHNSYKEIDAWLNSIVQGKLDAKSFFIDFSGKCAPCIKSTYLTQKREEYKVTVFWGSYLEAFGNNDAVFCPYMDVDKDNKNSDLDKLFYSIMLNVRNYAEYEVGFDCDYEKLEKDYREKIETLTHRKLCSQYDVVALTKKSVDALNQAADEKNQYVDKDYLMIKYYYDIDGLPFKMVSLNYQLKSGEKASKLAMMGSADNYNLGNLYENSQDVIIDEDGLVSMHTSSYRYADKIYKKNQTVLEPDEILNKVEKFYKKTVLLEPVTITDISLEYVGYFSDYADGTIKPIVTPVWDVSVYDSKLCGFMHFVYDAFSGECYLENAYEY